MICLELDTVLFSLNERKGKFLERTLEPTEDFANSIYQGSAEILFILIKKKTSCVTNSNTRKKRYIVSNLVPFLITNIVPICVPRAFASRCHFCGRACEPFLDGIVPHPHFSVTRKRIIN